MALLLEVWRRRTQPLKRDWIILRSSSPLGRIFMPAGWRPRFHVISLAGDS